MRRPAPVAKDAISACAPMRSALRWLAALTLLTWHVTVHAESAAPQASTAFAPDMRDLLLPSPYRLSHADRAGEIRYRLRLAEDAPWAWPETGEQHVDVRGSAVLVRICRTCGEEAAPDALTLQRMRTANPWVTSNVRRIARFGRRHATGSTVHARMNALVQAVRTRLDRDARSVGGGFANGRAYVDATRAYDARSGDCTEFAVLLAAAARAAGIPARVAYGVAYASRFTGASHVFSPHAWVQAWEGERWVSYDAGLDGFDAGHIALYLGDGSPDGLAAVTRTIARLRVEAAEGIVRE